MAAYEAVIGLEVHVQLATASKLFCSCPTTFGQPANANVCEVCSGMPGALPVPNRQAVHFATLVGLATNCAINTRSIFARKNYFYPDLPAGYQISQFELPICEHGHLEINVDGRIKRVGITRIHMENDAGKNIHAQGENLSYVDLNRAGTPLVEIVSEPDMRSAAEAVAYLKALYSIVTYLGVCDGNMEEGSFRCDANVSLRPAGTEPFGTRTELKNLNSFRNVQRAIEYEIARQQDVLDDGDKVVQETRLYDAVKNTTASMRSKEEAHDYRYFPDPDLLPLVISQELVDGIKATLPELPDEKKARFMSEYGLNSYDAGVMVAEKDSAEFFEVVAKGRDGKTAANWVMGDFFATMNSKPEYNWANPPVSAENLGKMIDLIKDGTISTRLAKDVFIFMVESGKDPASIVEEKGLKQVTDTGAIEKAIADVFAANPDKVAEVKAGKDKLMGWFVGQVMKATQGKANPGMLNELIAKKFKE